MEATPELMKNCLGSEENTKTGLSMVQKALTEDETNDGMDRKRNQWEAQFQREEEAFREQVRERFLKQKQVNQKCISHMTPTDLAKIMHEMIEEVFNEPTPRTIALIPTHVDDLNLILDGRTAFYLTALMVKEYNLKSISVLKFRYTGKDMHQKPALFRIEIRMDEKIKDASKLSLAATRPTELLNRDEQTATKGVRGVLLFIIGWMIPYLTVFLRSASIGDDAKRTRRETKELDDIVEELHSRERNLLSLYYGFRSSALLTHFDASFQESHLVGTEKKYMSLKSIATMLQTGEICEEEAIQRSDALAKNSQIGVLTHYTMLIEIDDLKQWLDGTGPETLIVPASTIDWDLTLGTTLSASSYGVEVPACERALEKADFLSAKLAFLAGRSRTKVTAGDNKGLISRASKLSCLRDNDFKAYRSLTRISDRIQTGQDTVGHVSDMLNYSDGLGKANSKNIEKFAMMTFLAETNLLILRRPGDKKKTVAGAYIDKHSYEAQI